MCVPRYLLRVFDTVVLHSYRYQVLVANWLLGRSFLVSLVGERQRAMLALRHRGKRMALNSWHEMVAERKEALLSLRKSLSGFRHVGLRKGLNGWHAMIAERAAAPDAPAPAPAEGPRRAEAVWGRVSETRPAHILGVWSVSTSRFPKIIGKS